jgi:hypothetical protein
VFLFTLFISSLENRPPCPAIFETTVFAILVEYPAIISSPAKGVFPPEFVFPGAVFP